MLSTSETVETVDGVTITYREVIPEDRQDAAFYVWENGAENLAVVDYNGRKLFIDRVGEMYLTIPDLPAELDMADDSVYSKAWEETVIRYTDQLEAAGIKNDFHLKMLDDRFSKKGYEIWHMNAWFEVFSQDDDFGYEVYHDFYEAVDFAVAAIKDDEYWDNLHNPDNYIS